MARQACYEKSSPRSDICANKSGQNKSGQNTIWRHSELPGISVSHCARQSNAVVALPAAHDRRIPSLPNLELLFLHDSRATDDQLPLKDPSPKLKTLTLALDFACPRFRLPGIRFLPGPMHWLLSPSALGGRHSRPADDNANPGARAGPATARGWR